jgi:hypothetical protein
MVIHSQEIQRLFESQPIIPTINPGVVSTSEIARLYFSPTTKTSFTAPTIVPNKSFSDVHKAAQRVPLNTRKRAPFWSRDMSQYVPESDFATYFPSYNHNFIPLPIEGSGINKELASTFHPDASNSSSTSGQRSRSSSSAMYRTRYTDDFASNVVPGKDYRLAPFRPKVQKHVREDDRLLYGESITRECFRDLSDMCAKPLKQVDVPLVNRPAYKLSSSTRYSEDFPPIEAMHPNVVSRTANGNRVIGSSVPHPIRQFMFENGVESIQSVDLKKVLLNPQQQSCSVSDHHSRANRNPYMDEFMNS